jgi:hypothetical protein
MKYCKFEHRAGGYLYVYSQPVTHSQTNDLALVSGATAQGTAIQTGMIQSERIPLH